MKYIFIGQIVTFIQEVNGNVEFRRGEVVSRVANRLLDGSESEVVTVEWRDNTTTIRKQLDITAVYPDDTAAALSLFDKIAAVIENERVERLMEF